MESESVDVVGESGEGSSQSWLSQMTRGLDPRIRACRCRCEALDSLGRRGSIHLWAPLRQLLWSGYERVDEGTEADTEEAASSFIDVVGIDSPEKRKAVPENGTRDNVAVGASEPLDSDVVDIAGLPDCKLSNSLL